MILVSICFVLTTGYLLEIYFFCFVTQLIATKGRLWEVKLIIFLRIHRKAIFTYLSAGWIDVAHACFLIFLFILVLLGSLILELYFFIIFNYIKLIHTFCFYNTSEQISFVALWTIKIFFIQVLWIPLSTNLYKVDLTNLVLQISIELPRRVKPTHRHVVILNSGYCRILPSQICVPLILLCIIQTLGVLRVYKEVVAIVLDNIFLLYNAIYLCLLFRLFI